ncbi:hypothetical protein, partial [Saccharopolyspora kobensis]|uniref:hypothetical protein n=1 Tax=Saccharopolyspora kobensis TaxID=146035 RepID=UPI003325083D
MATTRAAAQEAQARRAAVLVAASRTAVAAEPVAGSHTAAAEPVAASRTAAVAEPVAEFPTAAARAAEHRPVAVLA